MNGLMSRLVVVGGVGLLLLSTGCAGDPERTGSPIAPNLGAAAIGFNTDASGQVAEADLQDGAGLEEGEHDALGAAAAAAVKLSGTWSGTGGPVGRKPYAITVKFTHSGNRLKGVWLDLPTGLSATTDVTQKSTSATTRTFEGTTRLNAGECGSVTKPTSFIVNIAAKPMTITGTSKATPAKCNNGRAEKFTLKKVK